MQGEGERKKKRTNLKPKIYPYTYILNYILEGMQSLQSFHALKQPSRFIKTTSLLNQFPWGSSCPIPNITFKYLSKISLQIVLLFTQVDKNLLAILLVCQLNPSLQSGLFVTMHKDHTFPLLPFSCRNTGKCINATTCVGLPADLHKTCCPSS